MSFPTKQPSQFSEAKSIMGQSFLQKIDLQKQIEKKKSLDLLKEGQNREKVEKVKEKRDGSNNEKSKLEIFEEQRSEMYKYLIGKDASNEDNAKYVRLKFEMINGKIDDDVSDISLWSEDDSES